MQKTAGPLKSLNLPTTFFLTKPLPQVRSMLTTSSILLTSILITQKKAPISFPQQLSTMNPSAFIPEKPLPSMKSQTAQPLLFPTTVPTKHALFISFRILALSLLITPTASTSPFSISLITPKTSKSLKQKQHSFPTSLQTLTSQ